MGKLTEAIAYVNNNPLFGVRYHPAYITIGEEAKRVRKDYQKNSLNTEGKLDFADQNNQLTTKTMNQEISILRGNNLPLVNEALQSLEKMKEFCQFILDSRLVPDFFYPKLPGSNDRDYTKGNVSALMMVGIHGSQLGMPFMIAIQQIIPVNGLLSIKGDGAKSLILNSGKVEPGTWKETEEGSIEAGNYMVTISAQRSDTKEKLSRSFSVNQAKKAGLWVTDEMMRGQDGWKYKKSAWYKYPDRMIKYRALGFLARDLFPDVMAGCYTEEEARDIPVDQSTIVETQSGQSVIIPDTNFNQERSQNLTSKAAQIIDKKIGNKPGVKEAVIIPGVKDAMVSENYRVVDNNDLASSQQDQKTTEEVPLTEKTYTEEELKEMKAEMLQEICENIDLTKKAMDLFSGKNTNKKLREIILAYQDGSLAAMVAKYEASMAPITQQQEAPLQQESLGEQEEFPPMEPIDTGEPDEEFQQNATEMPPNTDFYAQVDINIPELPAEGSREFSIAAKLYGALNTLKPPITDKHYLEIAGNIPGVLIRFGDKEAFCKKAPSDIIRELLAWNAKL